MKKKRSDLGFQTRCIWEGYDPFKYEGSISPPVYQSSLFAFKDFDSFKDAIFHQKGHVYSRVSNPTRDILETKLALLEGGDSALAFSSGTSAIAAAIFSIAKKGDHVIAPYWVYGETYKILTLYINKYGVETTFVNGWDIKDYERAVRPNTKLIMLESPTSVFFFCQPLRQIAAFAKKRGIKTVIDNSNASSYNQRPLEMGIDFSLHTISKFIGGHSDVVGGVLVGPKKEMKDIKLNERELFGNMMSPWDSWLSMRGLRTLGARMRLHNASGLEVARFLETHPKVEEIWYTGLPSHPQHELAKSQMKGFSSQITIRIPGGLAGTKRFLSSLKLFKLAVSWGGFDSLVIPMLNAPASLLKGRKPTASDIRRRVPSGIIRLHIGLEDTEDLIKDLDRALKTI